MIRHWIGGAAANGSAPRTGPVYNPATGEQTGAVGFATAADVDKALQSARDALSGWRATSLSKRAELFFRIRELVRDHRDELARIVTREHGKVLSDAAGEVNRGLEVIDFCCGLPELLKGGYSEQASAGVDVYSIRQPLGVVAGITPFNFPVMVPMWMWAPALACGNAFVLKPSEKDPSASMFVAELLQRAGVPDGVFNVVHGDREAVDAVLEHPGIAAVSFVGSTKVAKIVYRRATASLKRCLALGGAKNHLIVMPDADREMAATNIVASMSGCAGQRCMAASVMVAVSKTDHIIDRMVDHARKIVPGKDIGPVISVAAKERIEKYIAEAEAAGAKVLVDGRRAVVKGKESGYFIGPTIIDHVTPDMKIAQEEVFGPVLVIIRAKNVDEALKVENASPYGNAASVFTESGGTARYVMEHASAGMVGVNVGVPVPREPFSFGGWNDSKFGVGDITGRGSIEFWTQAKKMTTKWNKEAGTNWMS